MITEHLQPDRLAYELGLVEQRRDPPVPVEVRSLHPGATRDVVLHGWAGNPRGAAGMWGLVTGLRDYAPGFLAEFCWWTSSENIRRGCELFGRATFSQARPLPPAQTSSAQHRGAHRLGEEALAAENRLTAEQLAALAPGDVVTIESGEEFGRRRYCAGTVARVNGSYLTVASISAGGAKHVERYSLRDGFRLGGGSRAELVNALPDEPAARDLLPRQTLQIDVLYRAWSRRRDDVEALRDLHAAIGQHLEAGDAGTVIRA